MSQVPAQHSAPRVPPLARIVPFRPEYAGSFEALNRAWIERYFALEENDRALFGDPYAAIIAPGGQIYCAIAADDGDDGQVVGACAVLRHSDQVYELAKMAVDPRWQGRGIGGLLVEAAITFARSAGASTLMLVSNSRLEPALRLYARHGFHPVPLRDDHGYARADVQMEINLSARASATRDRETQATEG
jgi:GNAT superfamily N-acetyltransferase